MTLLTAREQQIALQIGMGSSNKLIAQRLGITERTVKAHLGSVFAKLGVHDRLQLALLVTGRMQYTSPTTPVCLSAACWRGAATKVQ